MGKGRTAPSYWYPGAPRPARAQQKQELTWCCQEGDSTQLDTSLLTFQTPP